MNLFEKKKMREELLGKAESIVVAAEQRNLPLNQHEQRAYGDCMAQVRVLDGEIKEIESKNTIRNLMTNGMLIPGGSSKPPANTGGRLYSSDDLAEQNAYFASRGTQLADSLRERLDVFGGGFKLLGRINAASYEGGSTSGAPIVPVVVEQSVVPLAPPEIGVERLATVIPTAMDMKLPRKKAHGTAAAKDEGDGTGSNLFTGTDPETEQFTLGANMFGHIADISWELVQDSPIFQSFLTDDILLSLAVLKEDKYVNGSGVGEPEGLLGNVGAGVTAAEPDSAGNLLSIDATFDVLGKLNAVYHPRAAWLMSRAASIEIRKAQSQSNKFVQVFTRVGNVDYLHGYPVEYSTSMPSVARGNTPVIFGDFKAGYIIGLRGGAGVNVKILDQPKAKEGLLQILGYQRVDGRVRRSEALQAITLATS